MAALNAKKVETMLKCSVCHEIVQDPKTLSCFHSFCSKCVKQLAKVKKETEEGIQCPVCRAFTPTDAVKANFLVTELLEMHETQQSGVEQLCEQCLEKKPQWKCLDCKITLCKKCHSIHLRVPLLRGHRVLPVDAETDMIIDRLVFCTKHSDQPIVFNCRDCEVPLCIKCKVTQHESHKTETVEDTLERILPEVGTCVEKVKERITDIEGNTDYLKSKIKDIKEAYSQTRKEVTKALDMKEEEELAKLEGWLNKKTEYDQLVKWVATCNQAAKGVSLMGEIQTGLFGKLKKIASSKTISDTTFPLHFPEVNDNYTEDQHKNVVVTFKRSKVFKDPTVNSRAPPVLYTDMFSKQLVSEKEIGLKGRCTRISIIDGNIWAPVPANNIIQIFDLQGNELPSLQFQTGPRSVKQQEDGKILLASDAGMFTMNSDGTQGDQLQGTTGAFSDFTIFEDKMVAVNYNQNTAVHFQKTGDKWCQQAALQMHCTTSHPEETVLMSNDIFMTANNYYGNVISRYNNHYQFANNHQSSQLGLNGPLLVGCDVSGNVLIADYNNARFQLFNPTTNEWQLVNNSLVPHGNLPLDLVYMEGTVWILSSHPGNRLVKYRQK